MTDTPFDPASGRELERRQRMVIFSVETLNDEPRQDAEDVASFYESLDKIIVPLH